MNIYPRVRIVKVKGHMKKLVRNRVDRNFHLIDKHTRKTLRCIFKNKPLEFHYDMTDKYEKIPENEEEYRYHTSRSTHVEKDN
jgi:hypothetical protein